MKLGAIAILVALCLPACNGPEGEDEGGPVRLTATATPQGEIGEFGDIVPMHFTVRNESAFPLFLLEAETVIGLRRRVIAFSRPVLTIGGGRLVEETGLLLPGQELTFETPYRVITSTEKLLLIVRPTRMEDLLGSLRLPVSGEPKRFRSADRESLSAWSEAAFPPLEEGVPSSRAVHVAFPEEDVKLPRVLLEAPIPAPPMPFDPWGRARGLEGWSYCTALDGFVLRFFADDVRLLTENDTLQLPPLPFAFLREVDSHPDGVRVRTSQGEVRAVDAGSLRRFLEEVAEEGKRIAPARGSREEGYEVR